MKLNETLLQVVTHDAFETLMYILQYRSLGI